jgi:hydroquinone glucosyltransferase
MGCSPKWVHVILTPTPAMGHCLPFFHLAARLHYLGVRVTFLVNEILRDKFSAEPLFAEHIGEILRQGGVEVVAVDDGFGSSGDKIKAMFSMMMDEHEPQIVAAFSKAMVPLMDSTTPPCCIISDMLMAWTLPLAKKINIPRYVLHTQSAANLSLLLHVPKLLVANQLPITDENRERLVEVPGLKVPLHTSELPADLHPAPMVPWAYDLFMRTSRLSIVTPIILINTFRELEEDVFATLDALHADNPTKVPKVIPVGPLVPVAPFSKPGKEEVGSPTKESMVSFLDKQPRRSVVYIAFGTAGMMCKPRVFEELAYGLEASGQPFVWAEGPRPTHPNSTTLQKCLPPGFLERTKDQGMVIFSWAPQMLILQHPSTGVFVSHSGWNSVIESIVVEMPLITFPQRAEQKMNARYMVDIAKLAAEFKETIEDKAVPRAEVERVIRLVMQQGYGDILRENVANMKLAALKKAASADSLKTFVSLCCDGNQVDGNQVNGEQMNGHQVNGDHMNGDHMNGNQVNGNGITNDPHFQ